MAKERHLPLVKVIFQGGGGKGIRLLNLLEEGFLDFYKRIRIGLEGLKLGLWVKEGGNSGERRVNYLVRQERKPIGEVKIPGEKIFTLLGFGGYFLIPRVWALIRSPLKGSSQVFLKVFQVWNWNCWKKPERRQYPP